MDSAVDEVVPTCLPVAERCVRRIEVLERSTTARGGDVDHAAFVPGHDVAVDHREGPLVVVDVSAEADVHTVLLERRGDVAGIHVTTGRRRPRRIPVVVGVAGPGRLVEDRELPFGIACRQRPIEPFQLLRSILQGTVAVDHEEVGVAVAERVPALRLRKTHVVVVQLRILLMVSEDRHDRDPVDQWSHVGEEVIHPVALVAARGNQIAGMHQQARARLVREIGDSLDDLRLRLGVADRHEGERFATRRRGPKRLRAAFDRGVRGSSDDLVEILGVGLESLDPEFVEGRRLVVRNRSIQRSRLIPDPHRHRRGGRRLGDHAHRLGRGPAQEGLDLPRQGRVHFRRKSGKVRMTIESSLHFGGVDGPGEHRHRMEATVESGVLVAIEVAANRERLVAGESNPSGLLPALRGQFAVDVEPHHDTVVGAHEMMPLADGVRRLSGQVGQLPIDVVDALARHREVRRVVPVAQHDPGFGLAVVLDRADHAPPTGRAVDRDPSFERDGVRRRPTVKPIDSRCDDERCSSSGESKSSVLRRPVHRPRLRRRWDEILAYDAPRAIRGSRECGGGRRKGKKKEAGGQVTK